MPPTYPDIPEREYKERISKTQSLLRKQNLDALLLSFNVNLYYFSGFDSLVLYPTEDDVVKAMIIPRDRDPVFFIREGFKRTFQELAWPSDVRSYRAIEESRDVIMNTLNELKLKGAKVGTELGYSSDRPEVPGPLFLELAKTTNLVDAQPLIDEVRLIKSELELERIRRTAKINDRAFERLLPEIKAGMTEREIANRFGAKMFEEGADRVYYILIRSAERMFNRLNCAFPYDRKIQKGELVQFEWSSDYRHYTTEAKTVVLVGEQPKPSLKNHYNVYVEATKKGQLAARPGATAADVFYATKKGFEEGGIKVGEDRRSFGHGCALDAHEPPGISPMDKTPLRPGMTFVVETGGLANAEGITFSKSQTTIVTSGVPERLPPMAEQIFAV